MNEEPALRIAPEERLLLECAAPPERFDADSLGRRAAEVGDWERFVEGALRTEFVPLAFARLSESDAPIPRPLFRRLGAASVAAEGSGRRLLAERDRVLDAFRDAGVSALPLKGCALADGLYGDPALRPMGDLDLLIREREIDRAGALLLKLGYRTEGIEARGETFFHRRDAQLFIDAHTTLDPSGRFRILEGELWAGAGPLPGSPGAPTLSARHHLVHALLHAARHRFASLGPLVDAAWIASRWPREIEWETMPALARRWRCGEALGFALEAASLLFQLPVPDEPRRRLELHGWRRRALARIWPGDSPLVSIESRRKSVRYAFTALTTAWPGGFIGAARRFGPTRSIREETGGASGIQTRDRWH